MRGEKISVQNKTRDVCLASEVEKPRSVFGRMKGLIGRSSEAFPPRMALWIEPSMGIHTFGMRFPIDVAYLNSRSQVLRVYHRLAPFRVAALMIRAKSILELPAGTLEKTHTDVGDVLEFSICPSAPTTS